MCARKLICLYDCFTLISGAKCDFVYFTLMRFLLIVYTLQIVLCSPQISFNNEDPYGYEEQEVFPVTNLKANAITIDNSIKLNISWILPTDGIKPTAYHVKLTPLITKYCKNASPFETSSVMGNDTSVIIPNHSENFFKILHMCTYIIEVKSQPYNDKNFTSIKYTVPDCVGIICICNYNLPVPNVKLKSVATNWISVKWNIVYNNVTDKEILAFIFVRVEDDDNSHIIKLYNRSIKNENENIENISLENSVPGKNYTLYVFFKNEQLCTTTEVIKTFTVPYINKESTWIYKIFIPVIIFILISYIIWKICEKKCILYIHKYITGHSHQHSNNLQIFRTYQPVNVNRQQSILDNINMENNSLYVQDEISARKYEKLDIYEICYTRLKFVKEIDGGEFGQVFLAKLLPDNGETENKVVAVKKLRELATSEELGDFLKEISIVKQIGEHPNIVKFLGCCTVTQPFCMIMEYVPCGSLRHYLHALRNQYEQKNKTFLFVVNDDCFKEKDTESESSYITPETSPLNRLPSETETVYTLVESNPTTPIACNTAGVLECVLDPKELENFAIQIARGMAYVEQKQIVHRDLAVRNILIDDNKTLKISDFGMSRNGIYVNTQHKKVPLRWLSIEAIRDHLYTNKSDVWSYGVVLWEIGTLGAFPYPVLKDKEILKFLLAGKRLEKPENCTNELYSLMLKCWSHSTDDRPSFQNIVEHLERISNKTRGVYVDFSQLNPCYVFPPTEDQVFPNQKNEHRIRSLILTEE